MPSGHSTSDNSIDKDRVSSEMLRGCNASQFASKTDLAA